MLSDFDGPRMGVVDTSRRTQCGNVLCQGSLCPSFPLTHKCVRGNFVCPLSVAGTGHNVSCLSRFHHMSHYCPRNFMVNSTAQMLDRICHWPSMQLLQGLQCVQERRSGNILLFSAFCTRFAFARGKQSSRRAQRTWLSDQICVLLNNCINIGSFVGRLVVRNLNRQHEEFLPHFLQKGSAVDNRVEPPDPHCH